jgi:thiosulfate/3-mercaptopyruvate sulfurtransferase
MNNLLISAAELQEILDTQQPLIVDCRFNLLDKELGYEQYLDGHIPGAFYLDVEKDLSGPIGVHGGRHPLPGAGRFANTMRQIGLSAAREVIIYDDTKLAYAARLWWLLSYYGHDKVRLLDGGYSNWVDSGGAVDRRNPDVPEAGHFVANPGQRPIRNIEELKAPNRSFQLIDSRDAKRYAGLEEPIDPVAGHIPGAINQFWQQTANDEGLFQSEGWHRQHWQFLDSQQEIVVYCGSGVTACVNLLSMEIAGIKASLYPGSWSDWCSWLPEQPGQTT